MSITIKNYHETPPGQWRYRIPDIADARVAFVSGFNSYDELEKEVTNRYRANAKTVPADLRQQIVEQMCQQLPEGWCRDGTRRLGVGARLLAEFTRVLQGTTTLLNWWIEGHREKVPLDEATRRAGVCSRCTFNQPAQGCTTCNLPALQALVRQVVGGIPTPLDGALQSCTICGCDLKAKVHLPLAVLQKHLSAEQVAQFPPAHNDWPGCWLRKDPDATP